MAYVVAKQPVIVLVTLAVLVAVDLFQYVPLTIVENALRMGDLPMAQTLGSLYVLGALGFGMACKLFFALGAVRILGSVASDSPADLSMLFGEGRAYPAGLIANCLTLFLFFVGMLFGAIPGVIAYIGLQFVLFVVVFEGVGPLDAMRRSWRLTEGRKANLFLLQVLLGGVVLCAAVCIPYVVILYWPLVAIAQAAIYPLLLDFERAKTGT